VETRLEKSSEEICVRKNLVFLADSVQVGNELFETVPRWVDVEVEQGFPNNRLICEDNIVQLQVPIVEN
jgi:hypothetical protein